MTMTHLAKGIALTASMLPASVLGQGPPAGNAQTCDTISLARPGNGVSYRGEVRNSDYRFSATIPDDLVGWGAGLGAPFHGFTIYMGGKPNEASCIAFTIGTHVDLPEDAVGPERAPHEKRVKVGNRVAREVSEIGMVNGVLFENRTVSLQLDYGNRRADVSITLVSPRNGLKRTKAVFDSFLSHFTFW